MGAFGPAATLMLEDLSRRSPTQKVGTTERAGAESGGAQKAPRRWWFSFDGWRSAELEAEYVLA